MHLCAYVRILFVDTNGKREVEAQPGSLERRFKLFMKDTRTRVKRVGERFLSVDKLLPRIMTSLYHLASQWGGSGSAGVGAHQRAQRFPNALGPTGRRCTMSTLI